MQRMYGVLAVWNFAVFLLYGTDKRCAKKRKRRISERSLILAAFLFGSAGALIGMIVFRHKTRHWKFIFGVPAALLIHIAAAYLLWGDFFNR